MILAAIDGEGEDHGDRGGHIAGAAGHGRATPWARALIDACRAMVSDHGPMAEYEEWRRGRSCATPSSPLGASRSGACSSGSAGACGR